MNPETKVTRSIRWSLLVTMTGLVVCLVVILTAIQIMAQRRILEMQQTRQIEIMEKALRDRGRMLSENLARQIKNDIASFNFSNISELLNKAVKEDRELAYGVVMDHNRTAYVHTRRPDLVRQQLSGPDVDFAVKQTDLQANKVSTDEGSFMEFVAPIAFMSTFWGWVRLGFSLDPLRNEINRSRLEIQKQNRLMIIRSVTTAIAFLTITGFVGVFISTRLSKPLIKLTETARQLAKGNFAAAEQLEVHSKSEIGMLAAAFVTMSHDLKTSYDQLEEHSRTLEDKVKARTEELSNALNDLKSAQGQLVQSEKMAGLGTLVAGVAHEINNPTNFVHSGAHNMKNRLEQLREFIFRLAGENADAEINTAINQKFDVVFDNLSAVLNGTKRIQRIVADLRTFSRLEEAEQKVANIVDGLESTLNLVRPSYKHSVEFVCDFQASPELECWPAQLNQVFMNFIVNGCQAINQRQRETGVNDVGKLTISTMVVNDELVIRFKDDGCGIPEHVRDRIFEPFFTTKPVGEGNGLGLSITFSIVEKHGGRITVDSKVGQGTTFTVHLPLPDRKADVVPA